MKYISLDTIGASYCGISSKAIASITSSCLKELPYISLDVNRKNDSSDLITVKINSPILVRINKNNSFDIYFHASFRKGENIANLANNIQQEVSNVLQSMLEINNFKINIKIDNVIFWGKNGKKFITHSN